MIQKHTTHEKSRERRLDIFPKYGIFHWMRDDQDLGGRDVSQQWERGGYALHYLIRTLGEKETSRLLREEQRQVEQHSPKIQRGKKRAQRPEVSEEKPEPAEMCV